MQKAGQTQVANLR